MVIYGLNRSSIPNITLGADPEFELLKNGRLLSAADHYHNFNTRDNNPHGIGKDGHSDTLELRPIPSPDPVAIVSCIRRYITEIYSKGYELSVKGDVRALGGHIHLGLSSSIKSSFNFQELCLLYDAFLGKKVLELSGAKRSNYCGSNYKKLTQFREKSHGFEYRTPPSAIFWNPLILQLSLELVKKLTLIYIQNHRITIPDNASEQDFNSIGFSSPKFFLYMQMIERYSKFQNAPSTKYLGTLWGANNNVSLRLPDNNNNGLRESSPHEEDEEENYPNNTNDDRVYGSSRRWSYRGTRRTPTPVVQVAFNLNDDFYAPLKQALKELIETHYHDKNVTIGFFGFKHQRGTVSNLNIPGWDYIPSSFSFGQADICIGLPWKFRMDIHFFDEWKERVFSILKNYLDRSIDSITR